MNKIKTSVVERRGLGEIEINPGICSLGESFLFFSFSHPLVSFQNPK